MIHPPVVHRAVLAAKTEFAPRCRRSVGDLVAPASFRVGSFRAVRHAHRHARRSRGCQLVRPLVQLRQVLLVLLEGPFCLREAQPQHLLRAVDRLLQLLQPRPEVRHRGPRPEYRAVDSRSWDDRRRRCLWRYLPRYGHCHVRIYRNGLRSGGRCDVLSVARLQNNARLLRQLRRCRRACRGLQRCNVETTCSSPTWASSLFHR